MKNGKKIWTMLVLVVMVAAALTFTYAEGHQHVNLQAIDAGATLIPTGVNNSLNITFSDVTYSTVAPAFEFQRGDYNTNASWVNPGVASVNVTNATYLVAQSTSATATLAQVQYDLAHYNKNASYFFMESKVAVNYTSTVAGDFGLVLSDAGVSTDLTTANSASAGTGTIVVYFSSGVLTATANESATAYATGTNSGTTTLAALQFYDISVYVSKDTSTSVNITVGVINPASGAVLGTSTMTGVSGVNYSKLDHAAFQFEGASGSAMILDWGYFVFSGSSSLATSSALPFTTGGMGDVVMNGMINSNAIAPFDPAAANNTQYQQAPNATYIHTNTAAGTGQFSNKTILSNQTAALQSEGAYQAAQLAKFGVGNQTEANSTVMVANLTVNPENTKSFSADVHISTWNATGIQTAVMSFLKNYTANLATVNTGVAYSYRDMSIISYMVSNIQTITNLSASDAQSVRDYFDNALPGILKDTNLSLVDTNTSAIVAGAFAGDFYYNGMAVAPTISQGMVIDSITGQEFPSLQAAGFAAGSYIAGGAVIVPQISIVGFNGGYPVFSSGVSIGSLFGGLSTAGISMEKYLSGGLSDISGAISSGITKTATTYVVKPITSTATNVSSTVARDISAFKVDVSNLTSSIAPALGVVTNNVENYVKGAVGPISGAVSDLSSSLASAKNGIVTAVAAGASGLKSDIYTLGTSIKNGTQGVINTLGAKIAATDAVLSTMFTAIKSLPGTFSSDLTSVASYLHNSTLSAIDSVGSSITTSVNGVKSSVSNAFGSVASRITGAVGQINEKLKNVEVPAFSFITAFGAKLGYVLEIAGITIAVVAVVGIVLYLYFRRSPVGQVVEGASKLSTPY